MRLRAFVFALLMSLAVPAAADFDAGLAAYKQGDFAAALREWQPLAEQGDARAQFSLGGLYYRGEGVAQDFAVAAGWLYAAAKQGQAAAQYELGVMYALGRGVAQDNATAIEWYRLAAAQGHRGAQTNLGFMYENGLGVAEDDVEAVRWFARALPHAPAMQNLNRLPAATRIRAAQTMLAEAGYDPGPADGAMGARTGEAIRKFLTDNGLPPDDKVTIPLLAALAVAR